MLPAACAARGLTGFRMVDCCFGALAQMVPDKVFAASDGGNTGISLGGYTAERAPFIYVDFTCGTWGGRPFADGLDGNSNIFANMASTSVEITEAEHPIAILAYEFVPDKAGAGKYRGGTPYRRDYRFLEAEGVLQVRSDRRDFRPYGLYGGYRKTLLELSESRRGEPFVAVQSDHDHSTRYGLSPRSGWGRGLG